MPVTVDPVDETLFQDTINRLDITLLYNNYLRNNSSSASFLNQLVTKNQAGQIIKNLDFGSYSCKRMYVGRVQCLINHFVPTGTFPTINTTGTYRESI